MQERAKWLGWSWVLVAGLGATQGCTPKERDVAALLGGAQGRDAAADPGADAGGVDAAASSALDAAPAPPVEAAVEPAPTEAGPSLEPAPDAAPVTEPSTQTDAASEPTTAKPEEAGTVEPPADSGTLDAGDECSAEAVEVSCSDTLDNDCDDKVDCDDQDCSTARECCVATGELETLCENGNDDDCDGVSDCLDDDCALSISCQPQCEASATTELDCSDAVDEDCDRLLGCADAIDCAADPACAPTCIVTGPTETVCDDVADDDCDGYFDCDDPDCATDSECQTACEPEPESCGNEFDDDCDGYEDCADSVCAATAACCVASGPEVCDDGIDNNCDGVIDCPLIVDTFPVRPPPGREDWEGGAVAASNARLVLAAPAQDDYIVHCRSAKPTAVGTAQFVVCNADDPRALTIAPFAETEAGNPEHDGVITTQVRFAYPNGQVSQPSGFTYYVHSSLAGAQLCPPKAMDQDYFAAALPVLVTPESPRFRDDEARLRAPFVNIEFAPRLSELFEVEAGDGQVEYLSLRRRFVLNPDKSLVLMKRVYTSRRTGDMACLSAMIRKHDYDLGPMGTEDPDRYHRTPCDAVVLNKAGAGLCLTVDVEGNVVIANPNTPRWQFINFELNGWVDWAAADNFLWRKLLSNQQNGELRVFSPKCYTSGCNPPDSHVLFLPDRGLFSW